MEKWSEVLAVHMLTRIHRKTSSSKASWVEVIGNDRLMDDSARLGKPRPFYDEWDTYAALVVCALVCTKRSITCCLVKASVVGSEDDHRVVRFSSRLQGIKNSTNTLIDAFDHCCIYWFSLLLVLRYLFIFFGQFFWCLKWRMDTIVWEVEKERLVF